MAERESLDEFLVARRQELISRAEEREIDWESETETLSPDDDALIIVALASLLELSLEGALDRDKTLDDLEQESVQLDRDTELERRAILAEEAMKTYEG
jgi:hypothetical protein